MFVTKFRLSLHSLVEMNTFDGTDSNKLKSFDWREKGFKPIPFIQNVWPLLNLSLEN